MSCTCVRSAQDTPAMVCDTWPAGYVWETQYDWSGHTQPGMCVSCTDPNWKPVIGGAPCPSGSVWCQNPAGALPCGSASGGGCATCGVGGGLPPSGGGGTTPPASPPPSSRGATGNQAAGAALLAVSAVIAGAWYLEHRKPATPPVVVAGQERRRGRR